MGTNGTHRSIQGTSISISFSNKQERIILSCYKSRKICRYCAVSGDIATVGDNFLTTGAMRRYIIQVRMGVMRLVCKACFKKVEKRLLIKLRRNYCCYVWPEALSSMIFVLEQKRSGILLTEPKRNCRSVLHTDVILFYLTDWWPETNLFPPNS